MKVVFGESVRRKNERTGVWYFEFTWWHEGKEYLTETDTIVADTEEELDKKIVRFVKRKEKLHPPNPLERGNFPTRIKMLLMFGFVLYICGIPASHCW